MSFNQRKDLDEWGGVNVEVKFVCGSQIDYINEWTFFQMYFPPYCGSICVRLVAEVLAVAHMSPAGGHKL